MALYERDYGESVGKLPNTNYRSYEARQHNHGSGSRLDTGPYGYRMAIVPDRPPDYVYTAGETVTGFLLTREPPNAIETIELTLSGRAKTKLTRSNGQSSQVYRGRALLFAAPWNKPAPQRQGDRTVWPFSITFPNDLEQADGTPAQGKIHSGDYWQKTWRSTAPFRSDHQQPLPPTCSDRPTGYTHVNEAYVSYALIATARIHGPASNDNHEVIQPLQFQPWSARDLHLPLATQPSFKSLEARTFYLLPEYDGRSLTLKERGSSLFGSSKLPVFRFDVDTHVPRELSLGEAITTRLHVTPQYSVPSLDEIPQITLTLSQLTIKAYTEVRCPGFFSDMTNDFSGVVYSRARSHPAVLGKANDHTVESKTPAVRGFPPSFTTYNIHRRYRIKVLWELQVKDKKFKIENVTELHVFPERYPPHIHKPMRLPQPQLEDSLPGPSRRDTDAQLPQYAPPADSELPTYDQAVNGDTKF